MAKTDRLYTAVNLAKMPTDEPWELWDGKLQRIPGAGGVASEIAVVIGFAVSLFVRPRRLGLVTGADGTFILARNPDTVVIPDVGCVSWDRLPGRAAPSGYCPIRPDFAVEIRSPWTESPLIDVAQKQVFYRRTGVPLVWWVYPDRRTVVVFRDGQQVAELGEDGELDGAPVLPGFRLPVARIFEGF